MVVESCDRRTDVSYREIKLYLYVFASVLYIVKKKAGCGDAPQEYQQAAWPLSLTLASSLYQISSKYFIQLK